MPCWRVSFIAIHKNFCFCARNLWSNLQLINTHDQNYVVSLSRYSWELQWVSFSPWKAIKSFQTYPKLTTNKKNYPKSVQLSPLRFKCDAQQLQNSGYMSLSKDFMNGECTDKQGIEVFLSIREIMLNVLFWYIREC